MGVLSGRQPEKVFYYFEQICGIPHGSGNVKKISDYLVDFANKRNLKVRQDEKYNVIIWKEGSAGYEQSAPVILQGHMDMVAVKDADITKDMETEGLDLALDGDMLYAKGTSLGGDDGIAVAYALAVLDDDTLAHPPIEAVFTTDEEIGLLGADYIDLSDLKGRILLNMDSEDEGIFTVSCAGGATADVKIPYEKEVKDSVSRMILRADGLKGGHSGAEIGKGTLNANILLGRLLYGLSKQTDLRIIHVAGGEKDNAIPVWCEAEVAVPGDFAAQGLQLLSEHFEMIKKEYQTVETDMQLSAGVTETGSAEVMTAASTGRVITALMNMPNGIQRMSPEMKDMVQTSLSLGILRTDEEAVVLTFSVRSSVESEKRHLIDRLECLAEALGGQIALAGDYPGWEYRPESKIRDVMVKAYESLYGVSPVVEGIHAGLECGLFAAKIPDLDAISFGPQMYDIHTTREKLSLGSTARTWELLKKTLEMLKLNIS